MWKQIAFVLVLISSVHGLKEVVLSLSQSTLKAMKEKGNVLYAFQGVTTSIQDTKHTLWIKQPNYLTENYLTWNEQEYKVYVAETKSPGEYLQMTSYSSIASLQGQIVNIDKDGFGLLSIETHGQSHDPSSNPKANTYLINNLSSKQFSVGLAVSSTPIRGGLSGHIYQRDFAICTIPLNGMSLVEIKPTQKVFLMFAADDVQLGDAVVTTISPGIVLDMSQTRSSIHVVYDVETGWKAQIDDQQDMEATVIPPQQSLLHIIGNNKS